MAKDESFAEGYGYSFLEEPPDSLRCLICLQVARSPQQHGGCGKLYCKKCISTYKAIRNDCPHCRQPLSSDSHTNIFNDFKSDQEVKSLIVICDKSCGWNGELRALDEHKMKECERAFVLCPNECGNGRVRIMRKKLKSHLESKCPRRKQTCPECKQIVEFQSLSDHRRNKCPKRQYSCPHCNKAGRYDERTTTHLKTCSKVKVQCPKCSLQISRDENSKHPTTCTHEPVACKYSNIGCTERPLRKDVEKHEEESQLHLAIATEKILALKNEKLLKNAVTFKVANFKNSKDSCQSFYSPHFFTSRAGYKLFARVDTNGWGDGEGTCVSIFAYLMKGDNDDSLTWPFTGTVTFELLNQLEDKNHYKESATFPVDDENSKRVVDGERAVRGYGYTTFISHTELNYNILINCQYLKNDTLVFRVLAEANDRKPWLECTS